MKTQQTVLEKHQILQQMVQKKIKYIHMYSMHILHIHFELMLHQYTWRSS